MSRIAVEVSGGGVTGVITDDTNLEAMVIDYDTDGIESEDVIIFDKKKAIVRYLSVIPCGSLADKAFKKLEDRNTYGGVAVKALDLLDRINTEINECCPGEIESTLIREMTDLLEETIWRTEKEDKAA